MKAHTHIFDKRLCVSQWRIQKFFKSGVGPDFFLIHFRFLEGIRIFFHTNFNLEGGLNPFGPLPGVSNFQRLKVFFSALFQYSR